MKTISISLFCAVGALLGACGGDVQPTDSGNTGRDVPSAMDVPNGPDVPNAPSDVPSAMDVPNANDVQSANDVPNARDVPNATDTGSMCVPPNGNCDLARNNCCPGSSCVSGVAGTTCAPAMMCATANQTCGRGDPNGTLCCSGLVCMQRGGIGGMVCADPMCRGPMQSCDDAHPCCPSSACGGGGAMGRICLPTP